MAYLLDANCFMQAKDQYYPFDLCPGFWDWLQLQNDQSVLFSIDEVRAELLVKDVVLADWTKKRPSGFFLPADNSVISAMAQVSVLVNGSAFEPHVKADFLNGADPWLIAHALAGGHIVVTQETFDPNIRRRIKIPNVCRPLGVPHINTFEMMRLVGIELKI